MIFMRRLYGGASSFRAPPKKVVEDPYRMYLRGTRRLFGVPVDKIDPSFRE